MAGIYIHIPFCKQKCIYCNFYSVASHAQKDFYVKSLLKEIEMQKEYLQVQTIETIYWGGGTPSILPIGDLELIFNSIYQLFPISNTAEITFEANPEHLSTDYLTALKEHLPINRLSIGIQSFDNEILKFLNRKHAAQQAIASIELAYKLGFNNISADLIYGIPTLTNEKWKESLDTLFSLPVQHISAYSLTLEAGTMYSKMIEKAIALSPNEEQSIEQFEILQKRLLESDFRQYETSNFAIPGYESKHNSNYWNGTPYLGLGASAHSFNGSSRQWNFANIQQYCSAIEQGETFLEQEMLTEKDCFNEYIMLALRTTKGIEKQLLKTRFPIHFQTHLSKKIMPFVEKGIIIETETALMLSTQGQLFADGIASNLFLD